MPLGMLGKYERLDVLGHGASGIVYLAKDTMLGKQVALKELSAEGHDKERVLEEARVLDRLRHPNIVQVNGVDEIGGKVVIDMEYIRGRNLQDVLRQTAPLSVDQAVSIAVQVCDGLAFAHEKRTVHRDIKPANIIVGYDGVVKLVDFGLAEVLGTHSFAGGAGTYAYMAPEDFREQEESDRQSDIWAIGVILYEMLTGSRPIHVAKAKDPFAWKRAIDENVIRPVSSLRPEVPHMLDAVVALALAREKKDRYQSAADMAKDLRHCGVPIVPPVIPQNVARDAESATAYAGPDFDDRTVAAVPGFPEFAHVGDIDEFLSAVPDNWVSVRNGLLTGALAAWLRARNESPLADVADELASQHARSDDERLREFLYRAGVETTVEARRSFGLGMKLVNSSRFESAVPHLLNATRLDPTQPRYFEQLAVVLRKSGDDEGADSALKSLGRAPKTPAPAPQTQSLVTYECDLIDFGSVRQGSQKTLKFTIKNASKARLNGRVVMAPTWLKVEPTVFNNRGNQKIAVSLETENVWKVPESYREYIVFETEAGRHEIPVTANVFARRRGFAQIFAWYFPLLLCCLLPTMVVFARVVLMPSTGAGIAAALIASGLLSGSLFATSVAADTEIPYRVLPIFLIGLAAAGVAGSLQKIFHHDTQYLQVALGRTVPPVLALLVFQGIAFARGPNGIGRWQLWAGIAALVGVLCSWSLVRIPI